MKKSVLTLVAVLVAGLMCLGFTACGETHEEITGVWAVVYRFVDKEGNKSEQFVSGEYAEITEDNFTYYVKDGDNYKVQLETAITYHYGTSQDNKAVQGTTGISMRDLNRYRSYYITLAEYGADKDFGLRFYGANCMTLGRYVADALYAVLVRCENVGDIPSNVTTDSISGKWVVKTGSSTLKLDRTAETMAEFSVNNVNSCLTLGSEWKDSQSIVNGKKYKKVRYCYTYFYADKDCIVQMLSNEYQDENNVTDNFLEDMNIYFRNNG